jgi:hypothetical protein
VPPRELSVFDDEHPRPRDAVGADGLRKYLTEASNRQLAALEPKDSESLKEFRRVVGTALRVMIHDRLPASDQVKAAVVGEEDLAYGTKAAEKCQLKRLLLGRKGQDEQIPAVLLTPAEHDGTLVVWVHPAGKLSLTTPGGKLAPSAENVLRKKAAILAVDVLLTGEYQPAREMPVDKNYAGFTFGYNRPLLANRVHDILTAVAYAKGRQEVKTVHLVGFDKAGPWVVLARALCGDAVGRTAADLARFDFSGVTATNDEMMLPGALKYGGLPVVAGLCAPAELYLYNHGEQGSPRPDSAYKAAGAGDRLRQEATPATPAAVLAWLLR